MHNEGSKKLYLSSLTRLASITGRKNSPHWSLQRFAFLLTISLFSTVLQHLFLLLRSRRLCSFGLLSSNYIKPTFSHNNFCCLRALKLEENRWKFLSHGQNIIFLSLSIQRFHFSSPPSTPTPPRSLLEWPIALVKIAFQVYCWFLFIKWSPICKEFEAITRSNSRKGG